MNRQAGVIHTGPVDPPHYLVCDNMLQCWHLGDKLQINVLSCVCFLFLLPVCSKVTTETAKTGNTNDLWCACVHACMHASVCVQVPLEKAATLTVWSTLNLSLSIKVTPLQSYNHLYLPFPSFSLSLWLFSLFNNHHSVNRAYCTRL